MEYGFYKEVKDVARELDIKIDRVEEKTKDAWKKEVIQGIDRWMDKTWKNEKERNKTR